MYEKRRAILYSSMYSITKHSQLLLLIGLAITIHLSIILPIGTAGIRLSASDLIIPIVAILLVSTAIWNKSFCLPIRPIIRPLSVLLIFSLWLFLSIINGYYYTGEMISWALVNKGIGLLVLLAYMVCAYWLWFHTDGSDHILFVKAFLITAWLIAALQIIYMICLISGFFAATKLWRLTGFSDNSNAYGIMLATVLAVHLAFIPKLWPKNNLLNYAGMAITLTVLYFTGSKSAMLGLFVCILVYLFLRRMQITVLLKSGLVSLLLILFITHYPTLLSEYMTQSSTERRQQIEQSAAMLSQFGKDRSDIDNAAVSERIRTGKKALQMWMQRPFIGIGIGSFYYSELSGDVDNPIILHNTGLWLLVETGIIGIIIFLLLLYSVLSRVVHCLNDDIDGSIALAFLGVIAVAIGSSVGTEILYQRQFWLFLGCALAVISIHTKMEVRRIES